MPTPYQWSRIAFDEYCKAERCAKSLCFDAVERVVDRAVGDAMSGAVAEIAKLKELLRSELAEPTQIWVPKLEGPNLVEKPADEWVCNHCGNHGGSAEGIKHEAFCSYVAITAALNGAGAAPRGQK